MDNSHNIEYQERGIEGVIISTPTNTQMFTEQGEA